jgi:hypothetical protein
MKKFTTILSVALFSIYSVSALSSELSASSDLSAEEMKIATEKGQFRVTIINQSYNKGAGWSGAGSVDGRLYMTGYLAPRAAYHFFMERNKFVGSMVLDNNLNETMPCPYIVVEGNINIHVNSESYSCYFEE